MGIGQTRAELPRNSACLFFFQAEDGIRDLYVTGVQTCALPISRAAGDSGTAYILSTISGHRLEDVKAATSGPAWYQLYRSEERRVGKECRSRWWPDH